MKYVELYPNRVRKPAPTHRDALKILDPSRQYETSRGHRWTYSLSKGEIAHFCWADGRDLWSKEGSALVYTDPLTGPRDAPTSTANLRNSVKLLQEAMRQGMGVRCVVVGGDKETNYVVDVPTEFRGRVRRADPREGIEIVFNIVGDDRGSLAPEE